MWKNKLKYENHFPMATRKYNHMFGAMKKASYYVYGL